MLGKLFCLNKLGTLKSFKVIFDKVVISSIVVSALMLLTVMFSIVFSTISRYFFNSTIGWTVELSEYMLVWITFLSAALVLRENQHVKMDLFLQLLPKNLRYWIELIINAIGAVFFVYIWWLSMTLVYDHFLRGTLIVRTLKVLYSLVLVVIPFGSILLSGEFYKLAIDNLRKIREEKIK